MIKILDKNKKNIHPHYLLNFEYSMKGENFIKIINGTNTIISIENPYIERYCKLLNTITSKHSFVVDCNFDEFYNSNIITKDDSIFLNYIVYLEQFMYENEKDDEEYKNMINYFGIDNLKYIEEFTHAYYNLYKLIHFI